MSTCSNCGKVMGLHLSILQGCMCQYSMQAPPQRTWVGLTIEDEYVRNYLWERGLVAVDENPNLRDEKSVWVGLTQDEQIELCNRAEKRQAYQGVPTFVALFQEVEAKLKEKNNGS